jgi:aminopeptidase
VFGTVSYRPPDQILERYAHVLVNWALGGGQGISAGDVVLVNAQEDAKPLMIAACRAIWSAGGHVVPRLLPADDADLSLDRSFYELASEDQLAFFPDKLMLAMIEQIDHILHITGERDPKALAGVDPSKMMRRQQSYGPMIEAQNAKEGAGRLSWTIGQYGTEAMAAEAGMTIEEYWEQIIFACFLDSEDPVARWRETAALIAESRDRLNALPIERLHLEGDDADIWFTLGEKRQWIGGGGRNVPSFEIFTSPDWRGTNGWIRFSEPLYYNGQIIKDVELEFRDGLVVRTGASENEEMLRQIVDAENGNRVGEFSLTDGRTSRITRFMASTLYDENVGGRFGNTHVAIGMSIRETYDGEQVGLTEEDWEALGYNMSTVHVDIVSTADRTVTAVLTDGSERVIYSGGRFQLD